MGWINSMYRISKREITDMKHLRLFEDKEELFFWEIDDKQFLVKVWAEDEDPAVRRFEVKKLSKIWVNFTDNEIKKLKKLIGEFSFRTIISESIKIPQDVQKAQILKLKPTGNTDLMITKTIDEWFYVYKRATGCRYQCDQFDGLIECIEYLKEK